MIEPGPWPDGATRVAARGLTLRAFEPTDRADLESAFGDAELARWNAGPQGGDEVARWMAQRNDWSHGPHASWAVADPAGRLAGSVSLHHIDREQGDTEVGYWVAPWARRRGVATRALGAAVELALGPLGLRRVYLHHALENQASCRVAERVGFRLEGHLRKSYRYGDGAFHDEHLHALLAEDRQA